MKFCLPIIVLISISFTFMFITVLHKNVFSENDISNFLQRLNVNLTEERESYNGKWEWYVRDNELHANICVRKNKNSLDKYEFENSTDSDIYDIVKTDDYIAVFQKLSYTGNLNKYLSTANVRWGYLQIINDSYTITITYVLDGTDFLGNLSIIYPSLYYKHYKLDTLLD